MSYGSGDLYELLAVMNVEGFTRSDNPGTFGNVRSRQFFRVSAPVPTFVVMQHDGSQVFPKDDVFDHLVAQERVELDTLPASTPR